LEAPKPNEEGTNFANNGALLSKAGLEAEQGSHQHGSKMAEKETIPKDVPRDRIMQWKIREERQRLKKE